MSLLDDILRNADGSSSGSGLNEDDEGKALPLGFQIVVSGILVVMMMGLGATVVIPQFLEVAKHPRQLFIGLAAQFFMPFVAWSIAKMFSLNDAHSIGIILIGCTPGGASSNIFEYLSGANLVLGLTMTSITNFFSLGTMPLMLFIYTQEYSESVCLSIMCVFPCFLFLSYFIPSPLCRKRT